MEKLRLCSHPNTGPHSVAVFVGPEKSRKFHSRQYKLFQLYNPQKLTFLVRLSLQENHKKKIRWELDLQLDCFMSDKQLKTILIVRTCLVLHGNIHRCPGPPVPFPYQKKKVELLKYDLKYIILVRKVQTELSFVVGVVESCIEV